jgi:hypothetical protein
LQELGEVAGIAGMNIDGFAARRSDTGTLRVTIGLRDRMHLRAERWAAAFDCHRSR